MAEFPAVCVESDVDSLKDIATRFCVKNPHVLCQYNPREAGYELQEGLALPRPVCEKMLSVCKDELKGYNFEYFIKLFKDAKRTRLQRVDLSNSHLTDEILELLTDHQITRLNISGCNLLTHAALDSIAKLHSLQSLIIGSSYHIFQVYRFTKSEILALHKQSDAVFMNPWIAIPPRIPYEPPSFLQLPLLEKLVINDLPTLQRNSCFMSLMDFSQCLTHLDLNNCSIHLDQMNTFLISSGLVSLTLRDVPNVCNLFYGLCEIKTLRKLDISNTGKYITMYDSPDGILELIVTTLENLEHLDISGTNLAGAGIPDVYPGEGDDMTVTDIPGLASRVDRPLEFLGLLNCAYDACFRSRIPAEKITGHATEEQLLNAGESYWACEPMIFKVWPYLGEIIISSSCINTERALHLVIQVMGKYLENIKIQESGSVCIYDIVKAKHVELLDSKMKRKILKLSMDAMCLHSDAMVLQNFFCVLNEFEVSDLLFEYERLIIVLQYLVVQGCEAQMRHVMLLLNDIIRQVDGAKKQLLIDWGLISDMVQVVRKRLQQRVFDDVMKAAWHNIFVLFDATPNNGELFIRGVGANLFCLKDLLLVVRKRVQQHLYDDVMKTAWNTMLFLTDESSYNNLGIFTHPAVMNLFCLKVCPEEIELVSKMLRLLGNVAEIKELRCHLISDEYLATISQLLNHESMEVSYSASRIISNIASEGAETWCNQTLFQRFQVLKQMGEAIERWNLDDELVTNYRSLKPIFQLLRCPEDLPEVQLWVVWTLANLTKMDPAKYCKLLKEENGIKLLSGLRYNSATRKVRGLATLTMRNCSRFLSGC